jgi:hypothetical protein
VLYAKRRCMPPFFCAVNMSSAKIVSLNGNHMHVASDFANQFHDLNIQNIS